MGEVSQTRMKNVQAGRLMRCPSLYWSAVLENIQGSPGDCFAFFGILLLAYLEGGFVVDRPFGVFDAL